MIVGNSISGLDTDVLSEVLRRLLVLNILQSFLFCMPKALNALIPHQKEDFGLKRMKWLQSVRNYPEDSYPPRNDHITYRTDSALVPWRVVVIVVLRNCSKSIPLSPGWIRWIAVGRHGDLATWVVCFLPKGGEHIMKDVDSGELASVISRHFWRGFSFLKPGYLIFLEDRFIACLVLYI